MFGLPAFPSHWKEHLALPCARPQAPDSLHDTWRLANGTGVIVRAVRPDDGPLLQVLVRGLSPESRYHRFFNPIHELAPDLLQRFLQSDPLHSLTLLAFACRNGRQHPVAMAQYVVGDLAAEAEFAVVVDDALQGSGIGARMVQTLICIARASGIKTFKGDVLAENKPMLGLMRKLGFEVRHHADGAYLRMAVKQLDVPDWACSPLVALASAEHATATEENELAPAYGMHAGI